MLPLRIRQAWVLLLFALWGLSAIGHAGDDPFSGQSIQLPGQTVSVGAVPATNPWKLPPIEEGQRIEGTVDVDTTLNVRDAPWGTIIGSLKPREKIVLVGQLGDWYKIEWQGRLAWVHSAFVLRPGEPRKPFIRTGWINAPLGAEVRRVPDGDIIGRLPDQTQVEILGVSGQYAKIKWRGNNEAFVPIRYIDGNLPKADDKEVVPLSGTGTVTASALNVRTAPWGGIVDTVSRGTQVKITGKVGDWYRIDYRGHPRYVHTNHVDFGSGNQTGIDNVPWSSDGSMQGRIVEAARALIGSKRFRGPEVEYGNKACAQVVSTALVNAGVMKAPVLGVLSVLSDLRKKGWQEVSVPPFKDGDVITWKTYDRTGDGVNDPDTHIGIMMKDGGTYKAFSNSSRLRMPRLHDPYYCPVTRVMRKV